MVFFWEGEGVGERRDDLAAIGSIGMTREVVGLAAAAAPTSSQ
jgi:hypothetical protein